MAMTGEITSSIFTGTWHKHTDGLFYPGPGGLKWDGVDHAALAQAFLELLRKSASGYLSSRQAGVANYEHLFSLAKVVEDELSGESLNPAFGGFVEQTAREADVLWKKLASPSWSGTKNDKLASLAREAQVLIESVVRSQLGPEMKPLGYQALLALLNDAGNFKHIDLVSLNHDLLLDQLMEREGLEYHDGFSVRDGEVRLFDKMLGAGGRIHLIKPHGAINWHSFRRHPNDSASDCHGIPDVSISAWHAKRADGSRFINLSGNPVFLTGIDKIVSYSTGIFGQQVAWFRRSLEQTNRVLCSGYGWRDEGMNDLLFEWLYAAADNKLVILHDGKSIETNLLTPPSPWVFRYHDLQSSDKLRVIPKWLCCCKDASEIVDKLI